MTKIQIQFLIASWIIKKMYLFNFFTLGKCKNKNKEIKMCSYFSVGNLAYQFKKKLFA